MPVRSSRLQKTKCAIRVNRWRLVIAESRYIAEDALADIVVDMEPLPAVVDLEKAFEPGTPLVHDDLPSNLAANVKQRAATTPRLP